MEDISCELSEAIKKDSLDKFIEKYEADPTLKYSVSDKQVTIIPSAFFELVGEKDSIEYIANHSKSLAEGDFLAIEIAATGLFDSNSLRFLKFIEGDVGSQNCCDWDDGDLLEKSFYEAESSGFQVSLGHTHPVFGTKNKIDRMYGGVPSWVPYTESDIDKYVHDEKVAQEIKESKIYEKYRGDFCEIFTRAKLNPLISDFSWILSPALNQLGIFEVKEGGKVIYHPWIVW
ncbi:hypothetical protein JW949_03510 [Candidatus Woesearchaeota archaeon]|nr:hypothetical protein [Candidatus Woesearchaeota archaeon]